MVEEYQENYITGWIKVYRSFINWEWYTAPNMAHFFIYCLLKANHKDNKWRGIEIKKGQFVTSLETMKNETGLSIQQVRTCLKRLKKTGEINTLANKQNTIVTVCKYDTYQSFSNEANTQTNKQVTNNQQTPNKRLTTNNNDKNIKNEEEVYSPPTENEVLKAYNLFLENIKNDNYQMSVENWLRKVKGDKQLLNNLILNDFKTQLLNDTKKHKTAEKVKSHFGAWLNKYTVINAKS